jgi:hypothetical protein
MLSFAAHSCQPLLKGASADSVADLALVLFPCCFCCDASINQLQPQAALAVRQTQTSQTASLPLILHPHQALHPPSIHPSQLDLR